MATTTPAPTVDRISPAADAARRVAQTVTDPELPMLSLADLGVLRDVWVDDGRVVVVITPTYTGCPAMDTMRDDLVYTLRAAGYHDVEVRTTLHPPWSTDWISAEGKRKLAEYGIAPPGPAPSAVTGPVPLVLTPTVRRVDCPVCGSADTVELSRFSATACKALRRCRTCQEPFEHVKEI
ncbi:1,2-phenylacetyl-CoA epoxidase subunit PaaD [Phytoactinopolyspora limicola]|uniref:1,2-phenylacetyl-CoA epoxidase subunit PaaD n=1 Tax=Phytoactinopolyspora limicola TaxID=2715536 RepID=UPI001409B3DA|nr:1,2-phenylacetyl-CoA epoxidase subunit PaaD [Phytoactinopolyspora limicola]